MGLAGILLGLGFLVFFAYRGWSVLLLAPLAALIAAFLSGQPLLANLTITFMQAGGGFFVQFFPLFLLGALFGKIMEDSGSIAAIAEFMKRNLGPERAILAVVLAGALVTYGGISLFVAFFVLAPMATQLFRVASIPRRLIPAAIMLGTSTFTMSALPGTPAIQNAIPMPFFGTSLFAAPGIGLIASAIILGFGLWWLQLQQKRAAIAGEGFDEAEELTAESVAGRARLRETSALSAEFDLAEMSRGGGQSRRPSAFIAFLPLIVVVATNLIMTLLIWPNFDGSFLADPKWGVRLGDVSGIWSVIVALTVGVLLALGMNYYRLSDVRGTVDAGATASVLPIISVASLVGFGAVVAGLPAFMAVRDAVLGIGGGPLVSLAISTNVLAALTGSASGGLTIALDALGDAYLARAAAVGLDPSALHRIAVIGAGTLDSLPHNGAVITLLAVCGTTHAESYRDLVIVSIVGAVIALVAAIVLATAFGSF